MGRAGRFACIFTPMLATAATLALLIVVLLGGTNQNSGVLNGIYFMRLDTRYIEAPDRLDLSLGIPGTGGIINTTNLDNAVQSAAKEIGLYDFYDVSLFAYCAGTYDSSSNSWDVTTCSKPSFTYWFDPIDMFGTTASGQKNITFPSSVKTAVKSIQGASRAMNFAFAAAVILTAAEFVIGWFGLLSRWGSCCTTIIASLASVFIVVAAGIATALFYAMTAAFNKATSSFGVVTAVNRQTMTLVWVAVILSWAAGFFWLLSTCCCSGRRDKILGEGRHGKRTGVEKAPYTYERVASPYMGNSGNAAHGGVSIPLTNQTYEPMRHKV